MTKKEVMDYVTETPQNVNKNILGQKLDAFQKNVSWNDLKDKPFYTEELGEMTVNAEEVVELSDFPIFKVGDTVTVKVNGVEHTLVAWNNGGYQTIGGEQFGWDITSDGISTRFFSYSAGSKTVSYKAEKIHPIDAKYLPFLPHKLASCAVYSYDIQEYIPIHYNCQLNETGSMTLTPVEWDELCGLIYEMPRFGSSLVVGFGGGGGMLGFETIAFGLGYFEGARFECIYNKARETITATCTERNTYRFTAST